MSKVIHHEIKAFGPCLLVGRSKRVIPLSPDIAQLWQTSMADGLFVKLDAIPGQLSPDMIGGETGFDGTTFVYTVGQFFAMDSVIPEGLDVVRIPACTVLHTIVEGPADQIYGDTYGLSVAQAQALGHQADEAKDFCAEVYTERFVESQKNGSVWVLDHLLPIR